MKNKQTYSEEVRTKRKKYKEKVNQYENYSTNENLLELLKSKKSYNKTLKAERRQNKIHKLQALKHARDSNDSKRYWELIKQNQVKKRRIQTNLNANDFKRQIETTDLERRNENRLITSFNSCRPLRPTSASSELNSAEDILNCGITFEEVKKTIKTMKNEKASGPDGFAYEMLKNNVHLTTSILTQLFNVIQEEENNPLPWNESWVVPIYKSGNKNCLSSYRCINLSSCIEKLLTKILNIRLTKWMEICNVIKDEQTGFREGNSVIDNILLLKEVIRIYKHMKKPLYICFVDLSKAFDTIPLDRLEQKLRSIIPNSKLLSLVTKLLDNKTYKVLLNGEETESYKLMNGIPQGDSMSPTLFCIYINDFLNNLWQEATYIDAVSLADWKISSVIYADDIVLMSQSHEGIQKQMKILQNFCIENKLKMNYDKTKMMIITDKKVPNELIKISDEHADHVIEIVDKYKYLGMWIDTRNSNKFHIENLVKKGRQSAFLTTKALREFGEINGTFLCETFEVLTLSRMKYAGELCIRDNLIGLNQIQFQFYKQFCRLKRTTPNYCLIGEFGIKPMEFHFLKAALNYWVRLFIADEKNLAKNLYNQIHANITDKRFSKTWCSQIQKVMNDLSLEEIWEKQKHINKSN